MVKFRVFGSGSSGNMYSLTSPSGQVLVLDAGLPFPQMKRALKGQITNVSVFITHAHGDHSKGAAGCLKATIPVYASEATHKAMGTLDTRRARIIRADEPIDVGEFQIVAFEVKHNVECFGYMVYHPDCGVVCYITDTTYVPLELQGVNHLLIESNFCEDILTDRFFNGDVEKFLAQRVFYDHLSIQDCLRVLNEQDLSACENIVLLHLSDQNSHEEDFKQKVINATGKQVYIARPTLPEIDFSLEIF